MACCEASRTAVSGGTGLAWQTAGKLIHYFDFVAVMLMLLRKFGKPLANPCPCTGSVHADGDAEAWRAACKS